MQRERCDGAEDGDEPENLERGHDAVAVGGAADERGHEAAERALEAERHARGECDVLAKIRLAEHDDAAVRREERECGRDEQDGRHHGIRAAHEQEHDGNHHEERDAQHLDKAKAVGQDAAEVRDERTERKEQRQREAASRF